MIEFGCKFRHFQCHTGQLTIKKREFGEMKKNTLLCATIFI